jgi:hypothetical protein
MPLFYLLLLIFANIISTAKKYSIKSHKNMDMKGHQARI